MNQTATRRTASPVKSLLMLAGFLLSGTLHAEPRALLIGVGKYADRYYNLPGIDLDIQIMRDVAGKLGYRSNQILVLENEQATRDGVERAFRTHFKGTRPNDPVLIYYSGHGYQVEDRNGDEADGYDETLTLYELGQSGARDGGMLIDDDFNTLLRDINSNRKTVLIDACCSGTTVKSLTFGRTSRNDLRVKTVGCPSAGSAPKSGDGTRSLEIVDAETATDQLSGMVYLSAAQDSQFAIASPEGSIFTLGVRHAINQDPSITPVELQAKAQAFIETSSDVDDDEVFHPNLIGDSNLLNKAIYVTSQSPQPVEQNKWTDIVANADGQLLIFTAKNRKSFAANRSKPGIRMDIEMPFDGYLNVVAIDSSDNVKVMYPNQYAPETRRHSKGLITMPRAGFRWVPKVPYGSTQFIAIASRDPLNLHERSADYDKNGNPLEEFISPSPASTRGMCRACDSTQNNNQNISYHAGEIRLNTCSSGC